MQLLPTSNARNRRAKKINPQGKEMSILVSSSSLSPSLPTLSVIHPSIPSTSSYFKLFSKIRRNPSQLSAYSSRWFRPLVAAQLCAPETVTLDKSKVKVAETVNDEELWAAASLRVRTFNDFDSDSFGIDDHKKYLAEREFEALKERIAGKRLGFKRVSCINVSVPLSELSCYADDLCTSCKFTEDGETRVVIGSLDLNQCLRLPDEVTGARPQGIGADFARAYLSNVCVAKELQRNGLGITLVAHSMEVAKEWGITDLYVHVAVNNEPARNLYLKSGFIYESDEPAWQARFLDRPRRILLWTGIGQNFQL